MRFFFQYILPLAFPTALYYGWKLFCIYRAEEGHAIDLTKAPWLRLLSIGVALMVVGLIVFHYIGGEEPGGTYHPPSYKDGVLVPGHVTRDE